MKFKFGTFVLEVGSRELRCNDELIWLTPKAFDVLLLLIQRRPDVVDKQTILDAVWPDTFVSDASLTTLITPIRRALGDSPEEEKYIRTVPKKGYAFRGEVEEINPTHPMTIEPPPESRFWLVVDGEAHTLNPGRTSIGRDPLSTIMLPGSAVSWNHARVTVNGETVTIEDLKSTNGTYVRGRRVEGPVTLEHGDVVQLGNVLLNFIVPSKVKKEKTMTIPVMRGR